MHTNGANEHQHEVSEKKPAPDIFTTRVDMELCACGAKRWVDQDGAPATPWQSINLGTNNKPAGNEGARATATDSSQVSAGRADHLRELRTTDGPREVVSFV